MSSVYNEDDICITGMSGCFASADSVYELQEALYNKVNLSSDGKLRWSMQHPDIPTRMGVMNSIDRFDSVFFGVQSRLADQMDPVLRMLMEKTYEALFDAGVNPKSLYNTETAVFVGTSAADSEILALSDQETDTEFSYLGLSRAMLSNRLSYWLNLHGPSLSVDSACSSALSAFHLACEAIKSGRCERAIVGTGNACINPMTSLFFSKVGALATDGYCKPFDKAASEYGRAEAVAVLILEKAKYAKRVYAKVIHTALNNDGYKPEGITFPSLQGQGRLLSLVYEKNNINVNDIQYYETHGTGTRAGDPVEVNAIDQVITKNRTEPLKIGSIKSIVGHAEGASGLVGAIKVCLAYHTGYIGPNFNYYTPNERLKAIIDGRLEVVSEKTPWNIGMSAVSSYGFGGANAHTVLDKCAKEKVNGGRPRDNLPRLLCVSGRTKLSVDRILSDAMSRPIDEEYFALLHGFFEQPINAHIYRGYAILSNNEVPECISRRCSEFPGVKRPVWFVFSGMGSQWPGSGIHLMKLPVFAETIQKCHDVLAPHGVNLIEILTRPEPKIFDSILNSFVLITSFQIALFETLKAIGITPNNIIGHSLGEAACSYADGCLTLEQAVLVAYYRGYVSINTKLIDGMMAAVGLGSQELKKQCPSDIMIACHNGPTSCTISGPKKSVETFVTQLKSEGVFAQLVATNGIAYHSKYIDALGPQMLEYLKQIIPRPKKRTDRWVPTSLLEPDWNNLGEYISAEYHTRNLLNPVYFDETSRRIPSNAITIELSPQRFIGAVLKRSLNVGCSHVALTDKFAPDGLEFLLSAIGSLYELGIDSKISNLYPTVEFPVSRGTPMLSHLVDWDHSQSWHVQSDNKNETNVMERRVKFNINDVDSQYIKGHNVDGRILYPGTGYICMVWETICMFHKVKPMGASVVFEDIKFLRATHLTDETVTFVISIRRDTGRFDIIENNTTIVTGVVRLDDDLDDDFLPLPEPEDDPNERRMLHGDIYKEMRLRGYYYTGLFSSMEWMNANCTRGAVPWPNNWITFIDAIIHISLVANPCRDTEVEKGIDKVVIDVNRHKLALANNGTSVEVHNYQEAKITRCGGVLIYSKNMSAIKRRDQLQPLVLERYTFVANTSDQVMKIEDVLRINLQIVLENLNELKCVEFLDVPYQPFTPMLKSAADNVPLIETEFYVKTHQKIDFGPHIFVQTSVMRDDYSLVIGSHMFQKIENYTKAIKMIRDGGFIISREKNDIDIDKYLSQKNIISILRTTDERILMMRKEATINRKGRYLYVDTKDETCGFITKVQNEIANMRQSGSEDKLILVSQGDPTSGMLGFTKSLRNEMGKDTVACVLIFDDLAPRFDPNVPLYKNQLDKSLGINVYNDGKWGTYRHLPIEKPKATMADHAFFKIDNEGDLSTLRWQEGHINPRKPTDNIAHVYYSGLNYHDVVGVFGRISKNDLLVNRMDEECYIGVEFSGKMPDGSRVMGMTNYKAIANVVEIEPNTTYPVPDNWSLEEAATVPIAYITLFASLMRAQLMEPMKGTKVLVHAAMGGVGQACLHYFLHYGCEVFATVGSVEKREAMKKMFPQIRDDHIASTRNTYFEKLIRIQTKGKGVDLVINSLTEEKLTASMRCLAKRGWFIELSKYDMMENTPIGMELIKGEIYMHAPMIELIPRDNESCKVIRNAIMNGIKIGSVKPIERAVFEMDEGEKALRYFASSKHTGKILLKIRNEEKKLKSISKILPIPVSPRYKCNPDVSNVIVGGMGGFGLEMIDKMIFTGARKFVINSTRGISNGYQVYRIRYWKSFGVEIDVNIDDVSTRDGCVNLLKAANKLGPIDGIFNLAVILKDGLFENQTPDAFRTVFKPKVSVTRMLDIESRRMCPQLRHFVVFSSVACGRGNPGQTNYSMANAVMERICELRRKDGLPALAIEWGAIGDVGLVAALAEENEDLNIAGTCQQKINSCLNVFSQFMGNSQDTVLTSMVVAEKQKRVEKLSLVESVAKIMYIRDLSVISKHNSLAELGTDSLMVVELKQCLERSFGIFKSLTEIRNLTFAHLESISQDFKYVPQVDIDNKAKTTLDLLLGAYLDEKDVDEPKQLLTSYIENTSKNVENGIATLYIIPGINDSSVAFEKLGRGLKCKTILLHLGHLYSNETILDTAKRLLKNVPETDEKFVFMGYSYGALVAMEMTRLLEARGRLGCLISVEGSPERVRAIMKEAFGTADADGVRDALIEHARKVDTTTTWAHKLDAFYMRAVNALDRQMRPEPKIESVVVLVRANEVEKAAHDLDAYTRRGLTDTFVLEGSHYTVLEHDSLATIVNKLVGADSEPLDVALFDG